MDLELVQESVVTAFVMIAYLGQVETVLWLFKQRDQSVHFTELVSNLSEGSKVTWASNEAWNHRGCHQYALFDLSHSHIWETLPRLQPPRCSWLTMIFFSVWRIFHRIVFLSWQWNKGEPHFGEAESPQLQTEERARERGGGAGGVYKSAGPLEHCLRRYHELITLTWDVKFLLPHK